MEDSKVYVGDLDPQVEKHEVEEAFGKIGTLKYVWVARKPPGFAFVEYEDFRDAQDAVRHLDGTKLGDKRVRVEISRGRRGGGGGRGGGRGGGDRRDFGGGRDFAGRDRDRGAYSNGGGHDDRRNGGGHDDRRNGGGHDDRRNGGGHDDRRGGSPRRSPPRRSPPPPRRRYSRSRSRSPAFRGGDRRSRTPH